MKRNNYLRIVICSLIALMMGPLPVLAGGPLAIFDPTTRTPYAWAGPVAVYTDNDPMFSLTGPVTNGDADARVLESFAEWTGVATATLTGGVAGDFASIALPDINLGNVNLVLGVFNGGGYHVIYDHDGSITAALAGPGVLGFSGPEYATTGTPDLIESVGVMNGSTVDAGDTQALAWQGVFTHEFGHGINLAHTQTNGAIIFFGDFIGPSGCPTPYGGSPVFANQETMYPFIDPSIGSIGVDMATVDVLDDISALSDIYPAGGWPGSYGTITGKIFASDGITEVTGANVIARNVADPFGDCNSALSGDYTQGALGPDGLFTLNGLTPGAEYVVYVDEIVAGGFSTPPVSLPGPEEFFNGASESSDPTVDNPCDYASIYPAAGSPVTTDVVFNFTSGIVLGDDDYVEVPLPFNFPFCGICDTEYNSVFIGSNGFLTFGSGSTDFSETVSEFLSGPPRIAALWDDLNPSGGGTITAEEVAGDFVITYDGIPEFPSTGSNTFTVTLRSDGTFNIDYGAMSATDGLVGRSPGMGLATDPGEIDVSTAPQPIDGPAPDAVYEIFTAMDNDLAGENIEWAQCPCYNLVIAPAQPGVCYASTGFADGGRLLTIDLTTGAGTVIGPTGLPAVPGLAINSNGEIFGTDRAFGDLYRIDGATGHAFYVANTGLGWVFAIAFDENDVLYGIGFDPPFYNLRIIDTQTGASTIIGPTTNEFSGLAFDPTDGQLYGSTSGFAAVPDAVARIDKATGAATFIGTTGLGGATPDIHFDSDGNMYGSKGGGMVLNSLIAIDKTTAAGTVIGPIGFYSVSGMAGMVIDTTPPEIIVELNRDVLWPPNHRMVDICATVTVTDDQCPNPTFVLTSITSNEPANDRGDGNTDDDIQGADIGTPDTHFQLRAERSGKGDGRIYTIVYTATDCVGNSTSIAVEVRVPHDRAGLALPSTGFGTVGIGFEPEVEQFALIIPSRPEEHGVDENGNPIVISEAFDATAMDATKIYVGNIAGVIVPNETLEIDNNGDGLMDLAVFYSAPAARVIIHASTPMEEDKIGLENDFGSIGLHYTSVGAVDYLVPNIFDLGPPVPLVPDVEIPRTGDSGDEDQPMKTPRVTALNPSYPNPFNPSTTIPFSLEKSEHVQLRIFDARGALVKSLKDEDIPAGVHQAVWSGRDNNGQPVATGVYFVRLTAGSYEKTRKIVLIK